MVEKASGQAGRRAEQKRVDETDVRTEPEPTSNTHCAFPLLHPNAPRDLSRRGTRLQLGARPPHLMRTEGHLDLISSLDYLVLIAAIRSRRATKPHRESLLPTLITSSSLLASSRALPKGRVESHTGPQQQRQQHRQQ